MSEPSSGVPDEIADSQVEVGAEQTTDAPEKVDLDVDQEKLEKWDEVKSDYQIDPDGKPMPNIWDAGGGADAGSERESQSDAEHREQVNAEDAPEVFDTDSHEGSHDQ
jgi:hypothetical protein